MQGIGTDFYAPGLILGADGGVGGWELPVVDKRLGIKHGAADQDWRLAAGHDAFHVRDGIALVAGHRSGLGHVPHIELVVRDSLALGRGELGGANVHTAVELHGIDVDHLAAQLLRQRQPQRRFAGGGGSKHCNRAH